MGREFVILRVFSVPFLMINDRNKADPGHARVNGRDNKGQRSQVGADFDGEAAGDWYGCSVTMSADGKTVAVGVPDK